LNILIHIIITSLLLAVLATVTGPKSEHNSVAEPTEVTLIDFSNTSANSWQIVNDNVMGGISRSSFRMLDEGYAVFSGIVSLENNGGFASVRAQSRQPADLSTFKGLSVRVLGDGKTYCLRLRTVRNGRMTAYSYEARFTTIGFMIQDGQEGSFRLAVSKLSGYR